MPSLFSARNEDQILFQAKNYVLAEFDKLIESHKAITPKDFNKDELYKMYMSEAIEAKPSSLKKIEMFKDFVRSKENDEVLERVLKCQLKDIPVPGKRLELKTGIPPPFPWKDMAEEKTMLNFGDWDPSKFNRSQLESAHRELANYSKVELVIIQNEYLELKGGWNADKLSWGKCNAIKKSPMVASFLLRNFLSITSLNIRYVCLVCAACHCKESEEGKWSGLTILA